jgi:hypothetical protein
VDAIRYDPTGHPDEPVIVRCVLPESVVRELGAGTRFIIHSAGPLGGRYLELTPVPPDPREPKAASTAFRGEAPGDLFKQLELLIEKNQKSITDTLDTINRITRDIDAARGLIGRLIQDPVLSNDFAAAISELREIVRAVNAGEGTIGALVKDEEMKGKLAKTVSDLSDVVAGLKEERGTVGFLLNNTAAKEDLRVAIADIRGIAEEVRGGNGLVSKLINDGELASKVSETLADIREIVYKANSGPGTLSQVINNPVAWDELVRILVLARETLEDIREQAPVSTFVNALFATF